MTIADQNNNSRIRSFSNAAFIVALLLLVIGTFVLNVYNQSSSSELWLSLKYLSPFLFTFILSLGIILISWGNHRSLLLLIDKLSPRFRYANGFLLLTIVLLPFSTAFLAEYGLTNLVSPAVALFSFANFLLAIARTILMRLALNPDMLVENIDAIKAIRETCKKSSYTIFVYAICTILAFWFPLAIAMVITLTWIVWLSISYIR